VDVDVNGVFETCSTFIKLNGVSGVELHKKILQLECYEPLENIYIDYFIYYLD
jgi:hypothetical protein